MAKRQCVAGYEEQYENIKIEIALDQDGKAVKYSEKYGSDSIDYKILYNADGTLSKISEDWEYGEMIEYFWSGSNLVSAKTYYTEEFKYSEYENNSNIDLNWIISGGYGFDFSIPGFLNLLGKRSANYVIPMLWTSYFDGTSENYMIPADGEYTFVEHEIVCDENQIKAVYDFEDGNLVRINASFPMYEVVTTYTAYCKILNYDSYEIGPDGQKLYHEYDRKILSKDSTKEFAYDDYMLIEIGY